MTHGQRYNPMYSSWNNMIQRCHNPNHTNYAYYGGRGISVCDRWRYSFENFFADMGQRPKGFSIERINDEGNYEPNNCRWATQKEQCLNRRSNILISYCGETKTIKEWAAEVGISYHTLRMRLRAGINMPDALAVGRLKARSNRWTKVIDHV